MDERYEESLRLLEETCDFPCEFQFKVIGSQENNVHLTGCYGVSLSGNSIYSCGNRNVLIEDSRQISMGNNVFRRHTPRFGTGIRIERSSDIALTGCVIRDEHLTLISYAETPEEAWRIVAEFHGIHDS